jgi:hypothetical protein
MSVGRWRSVKSKRAVTLQQNGLDNGQAELTADDDNEVWQIVKKQENDDAFSCRFLMQWLVHQSDNMIEKHGISG